ncbi:hypothetical protein [Thermococcus sp. 21S9]|uniref:hypothetical protein n=1 Tax=Thermococcus sp. 21S9 TaxID=1638223 RepID=UPI00143BD1D7|nr:hypothetical protein [Thermococcus sp. 21S9]NJE54492.1 hypothetical protein [Thermococcus sp. 21S9]
MMRSLVVWLAIVSIFAYSYFGSLAYFSDSSSISMSLEIEPNPVQISCGNVTLLHCHCRYYLLSGLVLNATDNVTFEGIYFKSDGWVLRGLIVDNTEISAENTFYIPLNISLTPGLHNVSLILYKTGHHREGVMYIVLYINGEEYPLSIVPGWCHR